MGMNSANGYFQEIPASFPDDNDLLSIWVSGGEGISYCFIPITFLCYRDVVDGIEQLILLL